MNIAKVDGVCVHDNTWFLEDLPFRVECIGSMKKVVQCGDRDAFLFPALLEQRRSWSLTRPPLGVARGRPSSLPPRSGCRSVKLRRGKAPCLMAAAWEGSWAVDSVIDNDGHLGPLPPSGVLQCCISTLTLERFTSSTYFWYTRLFLQI